MFNIPNLLGTNGKESRKLHFHFIFEKEQVFLHCDLKDTFEIWQCSGGIRSSGFWDWATYVLQNLVNTVRSFFISECFIEKRVPNNATIKVTSCAFRRIFWVQTTRHLDKFTVNSFCIVTNVLCSSRNNPSEKHFLSHPLILNIWNQKG